MQKLCLKSRISGLDTVSTGSDSDLVGEDGKVDGVLLRASENFLEQGSYNEVRSKKILPTKCGSLKIDVLITTFPCRGGSRSFVVPKMHGKFYVVPKNPLSLDFCARVYFRVLRKRRHRPDNG